jgi:hypothetical protein
VRAAEDFRGRSDFADSMRLEKRHDLGLDFRIGIDVGSDPSLDDRLTVGFGINTGGDLGGGLVVRVPVFACPK